MRQLNDVTMTLDWGFLRESPLSDVSHPTIEVRGFAHVPARYVTQQNFSDPQLRRKTRLPIILLDN